MSQNPFQKATKKSARLRLALIGPPGSGKTYSALSIASGLAAKIAVVDTEFHSSEKYADRFSFDVLCLEDSFHPRRYVEAIRAAEQAGYESLVIDSLSHAWIGKDGGLALHDEAVQRQKTKNSYTAWNEVTPHHSALVQALVQCKCHLLVTLRSKVDYVQEKDAGGRTTIRKVGLAPLMRDGLEYEFDVVGDMDDSNTLVVSKSRCVTLNRKVIREPGAALGEQLKAWLSGEPVVATPVSPPSFSPPQKPESSSYGASGNGQKPIVGIALLKRINAKDKDLCAKGLCSENDLLNYVRRAGDVKGFGRRIEEWPSEGFQIAVEATREFEAKVRQREPGVEAPGED